MKATPLLLCLACSALAAPPTKKQPAPVEPLLALEKNTIAIDGHPESVAADAEGNIYFTCIGSRLTPTEKDKDGYLGVIPHGSTEPKKNHGRRYPGRAEGVTVSGRLSLLHGRGHGLQDKRQDRRY